MLKPFTSFLTEDSDDEADARHHEYENASDESLVAHFHLLHKHQEELAHHLHKRGFHMEIEYKSPYAARHGKNGSTLFYNDALHSPKTVSVSKSALAIKRNK